MPDCVATGVPTTLSLSTFKLLFSPKWAMICPIPEYEPPKERMSAEIINAQFKTIERFFALRPLISDLVIPTGFSNLAAKTEILPITWCRSLGSISKEF
jgi:hypothetical protein